MPLLKLDHVNIRTGNLERLTEWYRDVLGLIEGPRPPFGFPGAWLYVGDAPVVHLVAATPDDGVGRIEHFALSATGLAEFLARLQAHDVAYSVDPVPDYPVVQVNLRDCDGNHIHVDFAASEADGPG